MSTPWLSNKTVGFKSWALKVLTSNLPTSNLQPPNLQPPTSNLQPPTFNLPTCQPANLPPATPIQLSINRLASRWAAKEAVAKALSTGFRGLCYTDIEIRRQPNGVPQVFLYGAAAALTANWGECQWQLSLSHDQDYCVATALLVCNCQGD